MQVIVCQVAFARTIQPLEQLRVTCIVARDAREESALHFLLFFFDMNEPHQVLRHQLLREVLVFHWLVQKQHIKCEWAHFFKLAM